MDPDFWHSRWSAGQIGFHEGEPNAHLLPAGAPGLIVTVEYPQDQMSGPPFSVPETELRTHYAGLQLERVAEVKAALPRLPDVAATEKCFVVQF